MKARIEAIEYYIPKDKLTNEDLSRQFPDWSAEKIASKTGIATRGISGAMEFSSDLAVSAGRALFASHGIDPASIQFLIVCTQSPDYYLPSTAPIVQHALGLRTGVGGTDINLGCSGYVYGLGLAKGLIESGQVSNVLLITADTYSKFLHPDDRAVRTIFGDGASATLVTGQDGPAALNGLTYGTDGSGAQDLIVPNGGLRSGSQLSPGSDVDARELESSGYDLFMDGPKIFSFTLSVVPKALQDILERAELDFGDVDLFVFHQANEFMLEHLRKKLDISTDKFFISLRDTGNTVSSTIPIALRDAENQGVLQRGMNVVLLGFGVGLSWGGLVVRW